jgi:2-oxoglutarate dehydrogenase E1 component
MRGSSRLVEGIRSFGYAAARLDPLGSAAPLDPVLEADFHGLSEEDLEGLPAGLVVNGPLGESVPFVRDAVDDLRRIYCGADFAHMRGPKERHWLRDAVEHY